MAHSPTVPAWQRTQTLLAGTVFAVAIVGFMYWAQAVVVPVALALFLTFVLTPPVKWLQRRRLGRLPSVIVVVGFASLAAGGMVWIVMSELSVLIDEIPTYTDNIREKVRSLREVSGQSTVNRLEQMVEDISTEFETAAEGEVTEPVDAVATQTPNTAGKVKPQEVVVIAERPTWTDQLPTLLSSIIDGIVSLALSFVLVIFTLLKLEALRNRFIRLVGGRMTVTTKAVDDAADRITRYLRAQFIINITYGIVWGTGLYLIGVEYAVLWGVLGAVLRYVPYAGPTISGLFPVALSLAQFPGWYQPLAVIAFLIVLESLSNGVMEPWMYGHSLGVSEVALLISAAFFALLWGPVGLVLSGPLTVCLVVLGKHVPQLKIFELLLGDEPVMEPRAMLYQRLLARDQDEAMQLVEQESKKASREVVCDSLLIPVLNCAKNDRQIGDISEADQEFVIQTVRESLVELPHLDEALSDVAISTPDGHARARLLAYPARDEEDQLALEMLQLVTSNDRWALETLTQETLVSELLSRVAELQPSLIVVASLPPGGLAHTRYVCKRLRARFEHVKIVVARLGLAQDIEMNERDLKASGADAMTTSLAGTREKLNEWLPVLLEDETRDSKEQPRAERAPDTRNPNGDTRNAERRVAAEVVTLEKRRSV